jgi:molybdate transport system permease protein
VIGRRTSRAIGASLATALVLFLALPVAALFLTSRPGAIVAGFRHPLAGPALLLSLGTTATCLAVVLVAGTPLAWWLARGRGRLVAGVDAFVQLPVVVPPAVAGLALLLAFGRRGLLGGVLAGSGVDIAFTTAAVVMAQVFVAAPFYLRGAITAFAAIDERLLVVARTLGASPARVFFRVGLPLARGGLVSGAAMCWARALGEFGATLMFAGNLPGRTQTLPLAIYTALESDMRAAQALALLLVVVAFGVLALLGRGAERRR